jgi:hypothetical protein
MILNTDDNDKTSLILTHCRVLQSWQWHRCAVSTGYPGSQVTQPYLLISIYPERMAESDWKARHGPILTAADIRVLSARHLRAANIGLMNSLLRYQHTYRKCFEYQQTPIQRLVTLGHPQFLSTNDGKDVKTRRCSIPVIRQPKRNRTTDSDFSSCVGVHACQPVD